jgi:predicted kinase
MLGGLPGSGKSSCAKKLKEQLAVPSVIISSDGVRGELYGDESVQGDNSRLFEIVHQRIADALEQGNNVIFDATNLVRKHRVTLLEKLKRFDIKKGYILLATDLKTCLERNNNRNRVVDKQVIIRMLKTFNVPLSTEGWDFVDIFYDYSPLQYDIFSEYQSVASLFNQENPHHSNTLWGHSIKVHVECIEKCPLEPVLSTASILHDCGKLYTKVFTNARGEPSDYAHYYGHENVGAYESLFYSKPLFTRARDILDVATLIEFHMRPYMAKTDKAKKKIKNMLGEDLYYLLKVLHKADRDNH